MAADQEDKRTADEKKLFELIEKKGTHDAVVAHVKASKVKIDCLDPKGMTPLQLAAFRGNKELCEFLLASGADVNSDYHENSYSALMFAALSGKTEVTRLILEAGANVHHKNSVDRNAAQMAAFVGQHQCVSVINNFFPRDAIDYYTKPQGLETEAKLPVSVAPALCSLVNFSNLHPVRISLFLQEHPELVTEHKKVCLVLSRLVEKHIKARDTNEIVALKCHFIQTVIRLAAESKEKDKASSLNTWMKTLNKGREIDGCMEFQERLIRQALKDFPYVACSLLQQLVRQIAPVKIGDEPSAISMLTSAINGQQYAWDASEGCSTCHQAHAEAKCSKCKMVVYCNQACQRLHWSTHKRFCAQLAVQYEQEQEMKRLQEEEEKKQKEEMEKKKKEEEEKEKAAAGDGTSVSLSDIKSSLDDVEKSNGSGDVNETTAISSESTERQTETDQQAES